MILSIFLVQALASSVGTNCQNWFDKLHIKKDKDCELNCSVGYTDMKTFMCPNQCGELCSVDMMKSAGPDINKNFYGLTDDEVKICHDSPLLCASAYKSSWDAETTCLEIFIQSQTNDGSDACRHFVWAALLTKNHGSDKALSILNAHENNPKEPLQEKAMDTSNNRLGIISAEKLIKVNRFDNSQILKEFSNQLKLNSIIVIKPDPSNLVKGLP